MTAALLQHRAPLPFPEFSFAFQPIVDIARGEVASWEALVRGPQGQGAGQILGAVLPSAMHRFDETLRARAVQMAASLRLPRLLNLNFLPQALIDRPLTLDHTLEAAVEAGLRLDQLMLEVSESELIEDPRSFANTVNRYRARGVQVAIDDFGAGYSGLNMLAEFQPDQIKIDMALVRGIEGHGPRQAIVRAVLQVCADLGIEVVAEGIETASELDWFRNAGVRLFQGYYFARPALERLEVPPLG